MDKKPIIERLCQLIRQDERFVQVSHEIRPFVKVETCGGKRTMTIPFRKVLTLHEAALDIGLGSLPSPSLLLLHLMAETGKSTALDREVVWQPAIAWHPEESTASFAKRAFQEAATFDRRQRGARTADWFWMHFRHHAKLEDLADQDGLDLQVVQRRLRRVMKLLGADSKSGRPPKWYFAGQD